jgi:hypothetical protein
MIMKCMKTRVEQSNNFHISIVYIGYQRCNVNATGTDYTFLFELNCA